MSTLSLTALESRWPTACSTRTPWVSTRRNDHESENGPTGCTVRPGSTMPDPADLGDFPWRAGRSAQDVGQHVLELAFGVFHGSLGAPGDEAVGANQQRPVRTDPVRGHALSTHQLHPEAIRVERYVKSLRNALRRCDPRRPVGPGK